MTYEASDSAPRILVVGGGIAAQSVIEAIRERAPHVPVTMVCEEPRLPWDRVSLSHLLIDGDDPEELQLRPATWYEDHHVEVVTGVTVTGLDTVAKTAVLGDGSVLAWDRCVLATGSDALMPPIPGSGQEGVVAFRSPEDCSTIQAAADAGRPAAVIGGGLLGLEAARGIAARGAKVTVVHLMDRLMERQLDANAAALLAPAMQDLGVEVLLEKQTTNMTGDGRVTGLEFADGTSLEADLVVMAIGIKSRTDLAKSAGLECERGIVVDDRLQTSAPGVFAVGECAQHRGMVYGIVAPIHEQTQTCADALLDDADAVYTGSILSAKLKIMGIDLVSIGSAEGSGATVENREEGTYRKLVVEGGRLTGAVLMGDIKGHELLLDKVKGQAEVEDALELLAEASKASAADLPDGAQVCNCNGVCKGEIVNAITEHDLGSTAEVVARTRAGSGCGSCKPLVKEILLDVRGGKVDENTYLCACLKQTREQIAGEIRDQNLESVTDVAKACGTGRECGACNPALAYLVSEVNGNRHREERHARFINDRVHGNIQKDGTFSVVPRMKGGVTTAEELRKIADAADKYNVPTIKVTGGQRIDLLGIKKEDLPAIWEDLGMASGMAYAKSVRTVKTCVGTDHCRFGLGDSMGLGIRIEGMLEGLYTPAKVKLGVTGCPRNCAESYIKDIGIVAIEGGWEIYIGGAGGSEVRKGDLLATVETEQEVIDVAITFLQYYRETADYKERTYTYVENRGLDAIKEVVFDEERGAELRERFHLAMAAAIRDPWLERREPAVANQFSELDTDAPVYGLAPMAADDGPVGPVEAAEPVLAADSGRIAVTYTDPTTAKEDDR